MKNFFKNLKWDFWFFIVYVAIELLVLKNLLPKI